MVLNWPAYLAAITTLMLGIYLWRRTAIGRQQTDWAKLNLPLLRDVFKHFYLSRACRTIESLINAGVSILDTISITNVITPNYYYDRLWSQADADIRNGQQLSDTMLSSNLVPESFAQMVQSGEQSGQLGLVFGRLASFAEDEFDQSVKNITQFIEPVMIVFMGSIIGFIAIALLIPMFTVGKVVAGG